jgi:hypothetical protein
MSDIRKEYTCAGLVFRPSSMRLRVSADVVIAMFDFLAYSRSDAALPLGTFVQYVEIREKEVVDTGKWARRDVYWHKSTCVIPTNADVDRHCICTKKSDAAALQTVSADGPDHIIILVSARATLCSPEC